MATALQAANAPAATPVPVSADDRYVIIRARWNSHITSLLEEGAREVFGEAGIDPERVTTIEVAGTVELTYAARLAIERLHPAAVVIFGCVIRGDTPHFDYVCESVTQGMTMLNATGDVPVVFGVLTVENEHQARQRAGGSLGNKGSEAAAVAIEMANLRHTL